MQQRMCAKVWPACAEEYYSFNIGIFYSE